MPDPLPNESMERLHAWGSDNAHPPQAIRVAVQSVRAWHLAEGSPQAIRHRTLRGWEQTVRNAILKGWASEYTTTNVATKPSPTTESDERWREERAELQATIDAETEERRRRFPTAKAVEQAAPRREQVTWPAALNSSEASTKAPRCTGCGQTIDMDGACGCR